MKRFVRDLLIRSALFTPAVLVLDSADVTFGLFVVALLSVVAYAEWVRFEGIRDQRERRAREVVTVKVERGMTSNELLAEIRRAVARSERTGSVR